MTYRAPGIRVLVAVAVSALFASAVLVLARPVELLVDGQRIDSDVPPVTTAADTVFVPLRTLADALGALTMPAGKDRVEVVRGRQSLRVKVGDAHATIDGVAVTLKHAPFRVRGRVMVELKAVASAFNVRATYDPRSGRVDVLTPGIGQTAASHETQ